MGYFANGFVFTSKPDYEAASTIVPGRLARGYKHNHHPVWLLDLWKPRGKLQLRRSPFWPNAAGDPAEVLGLGTWDPLLNLEGDFAVVFEKLNP